MEREHPGLMGDIRNETVVDEELRAFMIEQRPRDDQAYIQQMVAADESMLYQIQSQPIEVMGHLSPSFGEILDHITL